MNVTCLSILLQTILVVGASDATSVVAKVNGTVITEGDVEFLATTRQLKPEQRTEQESKLIDELIDRQLIRDFLVRRKISAPADELAFQIQQAEDAIKKHGDDPAILLPKLGYTPERLKAELSLPLAWHAYARQAITLPQTKEYFEKNRSELDGTQVRAQQIFLKLPPKPTEAEVAAKRNQLTELRAQIESGELNFAEAAQKYSDSPSREQGGDVGVFGPKGRLPTPVTQAAFALKVNEISMPVVSAFGVHLIQVTERLPGDLSLEDVRPEIIVKLSDQLWANTVQSERKAAKIERMK